MSKASKYATSQATFGWRGCVNPAVVQATTIKFLSLQYAGIREDRVFYGEAMYNRRVYSRPAGARFQVVAN